MNIEKLEMGQKQLKTIPEVFIPLTSDIVGYNERQKHEAEYTGHEDEVNVCITVYLVTQSSLFCDVPLAFL